MLQKKDIAGTVILYNSPLEVRDNISTYINQISKLYVIDNSTNPNKELIKELEKINKVEYISLNGNKGIAFALNYAAEQALSENYNLLLTMDDDTKTPDNMIDQMIDIWNNYAYPIGILSGVHHIKPDNASYRTLPYTLTSGNLLNLDAYKKIGGFNDDLFIDHVDHEYGLRLNNNGYQVIEIPRIRLIHQLGYSRQIKIGRYVIGNYGSHSPTRLYYFARNGLYLARCYYKSEPYFVWTVLKELAKRFFKASFLQDNREYRLKMLINGIVDGWKGKLGELKS